MFRIHLFLHYKFDETEAKSFNGLLEKIVSRLIVNL